LEETDKLFRSLFLRRASKIINRFGVNQFGKSATSEGEQ
jgi:hypothetical protein